MTPGKSTNPAFREFAASLREAAQKLKRAAETAANSLHHPQMDFGRVRRHLESMAACAEDEKIRLAYVKHNTLTDARPHRRSLGHVRAGRISSEKKRLAAIENGRKGGTSKSPLKQDTARANGKLGGRPRKRPKSKIRGAGPVSENQLQLPSISRPPMSAQQRETRPFAEW